MKVLMHYNGAFSENAGVSRVVLGLGKALEEKGIEVDYLYGYNAPKEMHSYLGSLDGRMHFLHHSPLTTLFFARWIKGKDFDIVHSHTPEAAFDAVIARALLRKKYRVVVHLHGSDKAVRQEWKEELRRGNVVYNWKTDFYLLASIFKGWCAMKSADFFTAVSGTVKKEAKCFYGVNSSVVFNAVDCSEFKKIPKKKARKELGLSEEAFVILFVGNSSWVKGLKYLTGAVRSMDAFLLAVGLDSDSGVKELLGESVRFDGFVEHERLSFYYSAADVLCVPSVYEAFGLMFAEAQCFNLPCIGCKDTGAEEIIKNGKNGFLVEKRGVPGLKKALEKNRKTKIDDLESKHFSWKEGAEQCFKIFSGLIK